MLTAVVQLRRRDVELARAEPHDARQVRRARCSSSCLAFAIGLPQTGGHYTPAAPPGSFAHRGVRARAGVGALGVRRLGRPVASSPARCKDPRRNLPRAIIIGTLAVIAIYLLANLAYLAVMPVEEIRTLAARRGRRRAAADRRARRGVRRHHRDALDLRHAQRDAAHRAAHLLRHGGRRAVLPPRRARCTRASARPYVSILLATVARHAVRACCAPSSSSPTPSSRRSCRSTRSPWRRCSCCAGAPTTIRRSARRGYPVVPALFILATLFLLGNAIIDPASRWATLGVLGIIVLGIPVYYLTRGSPTRT